jgi:hypothetical protein
VEVKCISGYYLLDKHVELLPLFAGSHTTAEAAFLRDRSYISFESNRANVYYDDSSFDCYFEKEHESIIINIISIIIFI